MRTRWLFLLAALVVVAGVGIALYRGAGPLPKPEACSATVANHKVDLSLEQAGNAGLISAIAVRRGLPARAASIALATAYQESKLRNLTHGDRDSLGLFQQRPSQGWGTIAQVRDPYYATNAFYDSLVKIHGYERMRITEAAQRVQRSGFPEAYEDHAADARALASALTGFSSGGRFSCVVHASAERRGAGPVRTALLKAYGGLTVKTSGRTVTVTVPAGTTGNRRGWSVAQFLVADAKQLRIQRVAFGGKQWRVGEASEKGWTTASASSTRVRIETG